MLQKHQYIIAVISIIILLSCNLAKEKSKKVDTAVSSGHNHLQQANWILGYWQNNTEDEDATEIWTKENDSTFTANSFIIVEEDTIFYEIVTLKQRNDSINYIVNIKNNPNEKAVSFSLTNSTDSSLVFENPQHDFPTKIVYSKIGNDSLYAEISGTVNGSEKKEGFPFKKEKPSK